MAEDVRADLDALLELHHERLVECRKRNELLVERTIAVVIILVGFLVFGDVKPSTQIKFLAVAGLLAGSMGICVILYKNNLTYVQNAKVIGNISRLLRLYEQNSEIGTPLYPSEWESFGDKRALQICWPLWLLVLVIAIIAAVAMSVR
jgi:hypothetical protein